MANNMKKAERETREGSLLVDLYELTMVQVYHRNGIHQRQAQFDHFFRSYPNYGSHHAGYCINAGLEAFLDWMESVEFSERDLDVLRAQKKRSGEPLFDKEFLEWLRHEWSLEGIVLEAIPEGRVVHPQVPLTVVRGPLGVSQTIESSLLNHLNYPTLIATKASRLKQCGQNRPLLEFGMRRGPEDGVHAGIRAALIGGADFSSCVGTSAVLGFPAKGTHAHSLIEAFIALGGSELDAFRAYAEVYPDDCILLVDTVNTLESGVPNAITVFDELKRKGHKPDGVRLDSGDLAYLSIQTAVMLEAAGHKEARIVISNQLEELSLMQILSQIQEEAPRYGLDPAAVIQRMAFGIGTSLITSKGDSALDGVYKLVAMQHDHRWSPVVKLSETRAKVPTPGTKRVWRLYDRRDKAIADVLSLEEEDLQSMSAIDLYHPLDERLRRRLGQRDIAGVESLLQVAWSDGKRRTPIPDIEAMRRQRERDLQRLDPGVRRIVNPHTYHVSLTRSLWELKSAISSRVRDGAH